MSFIFGQSIYKIFKHSQPLQKNVFTCRSLAFFRKGNKIKEVSPYIIVRANKEEFDEILSVMHDSYYNEEPTYSTLNITPNPILDEQTLRLMAEGLTLVAKCKYNGRIVGACINESTHPWDPDMEEKLACTVKDDNIKKLMMFYAYMKRAPDLWRCLGVQRVFEMSYLFVQKPHRKKGLAFRLLRESKALGADAGFPVIRCDATSGHTAKICKHLGMKKVAEIPYCTYLDQKLEPVFRPPWPNEAVEVYCDCAPQFNLLNTKLQKNSKLSILRKPKTPNNDVENM